MNASFDVEFNRPQPVEMFHVENRFCIKDIMLFGGASLNCFSKQNPAADVGHQWPGPIAKHECNDERPDDTDRRSSPG